MCQNRWVVLAVVHTHRGIPCSEGHQCGARTLRNSYALGPAETIWWFKLWCPVLAMACAKQRTRAYFLSLAQSKLRLYSANHRPGYWRTAWAYSKQETENWLSNAESISMSWCHYVTSLLCQEQPQSWQHKSKHQWHLNGLVQDCSNSSALAMELLQSCTKPSIYLLESPKWNDFI